jgi:hypothetical protein
MAWLANPSSAFRDREEVSAPRVNAALTTFCGSLSRLFLSAALTYTVTFG